MTLQGDLPKLALALEYVDLGAALYLAGGSDYAARLLAAAGEQLLGDLARLLGEQEQTEQLYGLLRRVAAHYNAPRVGIRGHAQARGVQLALARASEMGGLPGAEAREQTGALLRAAWYLLESMGLEAAAPQRLQQAIELSTIHGQETL